jgi:excisionase family DNA binding protein
MKTDRLLSVNDVVDRTSLSERMVRRLIAEGRLRAVRLAGMRAVRVPESALSSLLQPCNGGEGRYGHGLA